jgi:Beta-glucosidase-related glycosidases
MRVSCSERKLAEMYSQVHQLMYPFGVYCLGTMESTNQILVTGVPGPTLDAETAKMFRRVQPGGYILFGRNVESAVQLRKLVDDLRDLSQVEPFIMIDEEGGVFRGSGK